MDGKIEQRVLIKFCVKLGKFAVETLEMLHETFGEHTLTRTAVFEWHSRFKAGRVSLEMTKVQGDQAPAKRQKLLKKSITRPRRPSPNNPSARRYRWDQL
jgi:hypothetical protein